MAAGLVIITKPAAVSALIYNEARKCPPPQQVGARIPKQAASISPASLKRQEEVLPMAKLEQRRYNQQGFHRELVMTGKGNGGKFFLYRRRWNAWGKPDGRDGSQHIFFRQVQAGDFRSD